MAEKYTHYSYLPRMLPPGREPTGMFNLSVSGVETRRCLIHSLNRNGELLARLPFEEISNMRQLRGAINWLY